MTARSVVSLARLQQVLAQAGKVKVTSDHVVAKDSDFELALILPNPSSCSHRQPTNLHKSFDGLNEIRHTLGHDPLGGQVFGFLHRRKNQVKLIVWTRGGFTIRAQAARFSRVTGDTTSTALDVHELAMWLESIDMSRPTGP